MTAREKLLRIGRKQGPCLICGQPNHLARHRLWDAIDCDARSQRSWWQISRDYNVSPREVRLVREAYAEARRKHWPLPGRADW